MAINGVGGVSESGKVNLDTQDDENFIVSVTANGVTRDLSSDEDELQSFDENEEELTGEEKIMADKMDICQRQIDNLLKQLESLRADMRTATMQLATGGDAATTMQTLSSINQSINSVYDSINKTYLQMMSYETELDASTLDYVNTGTTSGSNSYKLRDNATKEGKNVVDKGLSFDDKSASQMKNIMESKGYRYHEGAWCADFVTFVLGEAYGKNNVPGDFLNSCQNTAYCPTIASWAKGNGSWTTDASTLQPGDIVLFDWDGDGSADHTGIFISLNSDGTINTVEGNTTGAAGSSCVESKVRAPKTILGYSRLSGLS